MRFFLIAWFMIALTVVDTNAQVSTDFRETFDNNDREWWTGSTEDDDFSGEISDGLYKLEKSSTSGFRYTYQSVQLPKARNFSIKVKMRVTNAEDEYLTGVVFNGKDASNLYALVSAPDSKAGLFRFKDGDAEWIRETRSIKNLNEIGEWNTYEIRRENDALACFINNSFVGEFSYSYYLVFGEVFGFYIEGEASIEVDEAVVTTWGMDAIDLAEGAQANAKPISLGPGVNTSASELVDCVSPDGSLLVISRNHHPDNIGDSTARDIWYTTKNADGTWAEMKNIGKPLNTSGHNFAVAITQDLNTLFIQGVYNSDGSSTTSNGISESNRTKDGWSMPKSLLIDDYYNDGDLINSHISSDGQVLVLSLERADTKGANDLYVSFRTSAGFTAPKNMGSTLNTIGLEMAPFIAADGRTLYFSTNGHPGFEGRDIFVSVRQDDTWLNWSKPKNLGKPINTDEHDVFFQVPASGEVGYYSSTKNAVGRDDIFSIALPKSARPQPVVMARGRVLDAETRKPVQGRVVYEDLANNSTVGEAVSSPTDGAYRIALAHGKLYGVHAEAEGYYPLSEQFDARNLSTYTESDKDLLLTPVKVNTAIRLNNVFFDQGKFDLRPESFAELDRLAEFLTSNGSANIELGGHTDNIGSDADNATLSQNRVNSVKTYLTSKGIVAARLTAKGYGESKPVASNDTEDGRQQNRRVEFTILKK